MFDSFMDSHPRQQHPRMTYYFGGDEFEDFNGLGAFYRFIKRDMDTLLTVFDDQTMEELFPARRANEFFEALFGDADEGAYDIRLRFHGHDTPTNSLQFFLDLHERPGCCLACNLTYGLPEVFSRHPVINIKGLVAGIEEKLDGRAQCGDWKLGTTVQQGRGLHSIPLTIQLG